MARTTRIYQDQEITLQRSLELDEQAASHVARVLRMREGQDVTLFNGRGGEYRARIELVQRRKVSLFVEQFDPVERESSLQIHLGQALVRGERMDYAIQKAVEIGVQDITPLNTEFSGVPLKQDRLQSRQRHWRQVIISACEQCGRNWLPRLHPVMTLQQWLQADQNGQRWILQAGNYQRPQLQSGKTQYITIGPEGGFSELELGLADQHGFVGLSLGARILRTETAGLAAAVHLQCLAGVMD